MVNCLRKFIKNPSPEGTSWNDIPPSFGLIKGLHLEYLEFPNKIKKNAPVPPEPVYNVKLAEETVVKEENVFDDVESARDGTESRESEEENNDSIDQNELNFLGEFGESPEKKDEESISSQKSMIPKYVKIDPVESELDSNEQFIKDQVELRLARIKLKQMHNKGTDIGIDPEGLDDIDLPTARILLATIEKTVLTGRSISMNRFGLMSVFFGTDMLAKMVTDKMKGYFDYEMEIIHVYDDILEEMGETQITDIFNTLDPTVKLCGLVGLTTGGYFLLQNYIGEDKVKGAKLIQQFFPKHSKFIEDITTASKNQKTSEKKKTPKKHRGPSFGADDINKM